MYAGAKLAEATSDKLASRTVLSCVYGSTEMVASKACFDREEWGYLSSPPASGAKMVPHGESTNPDNGSDVTSSQKHTTQLHELVLVRQKDIEHLQSVFMLFPSLQEYHTKDLWLQHPTKPSLWRLVARTDDLVKTSWLAKFRAHDTEAVVETHPDVRAALVGGDRRDERFLIVEARVLGDGERGLSGEAKASVGVSSVMSEEEKEEFLDRIWPVVEMAYEGVAECVRIRRGLVLVMGGDKRLPVTFKGSVRRREVLDMFEGEVEELYKKLET